MFAGMGFLLATIWIRLGSDAAKIQDYLSVCFFSVAFLSFMSVSGVPAVRLACAERSAYARSSSRSVPFSCASVARAFTVRTESDRGARLRRAGPGIYSIANTLTILPFVRADLATRLR